MDGEFIIQTNDNIEFKLPRSILNMLNNLQNHVEQIGNILKLNSIKSTEFSLIIEYCHHHNYIHPAPITRPLKFNELKRCVSYEWDAEFINALDIDRVIDLLISSECLNCRSIVDLCYARLALLFRVTPITELKQFFHLSESEFTETDLKEVKEGNKWLMNLTDDRIKELDNSNN